MQEPVVVLDHEIGITPDRERLVFDGGADTAEVDRGWFGDLHPDRPIRQFVVH